MNETSIHFSFDHGIRSKLRIINMIIDEKQRDCLWGFIITQIIQANEAL